MSSTYQAVVLASRPKNNIVPGETFKLITKPTPKASDLKDGEVIFETIYLSLDPAMRGWLNGRCFGFPHTII
jgi:NADPH-dependent curcumin reductase CurA